MTPDELKSISKGNFIVMKTGAHPMKTKLKLFLDWSITFEGEFKVTEKANRKVVYADKTTLEHNILQSEYVVKGFDIPPAEETPTKTEKTGGQNHTPVKERRKSKNIFENKGNVNFEDKEMRGQKR